MGLFDAVATLLGGAADRGQRQTQHIQNLRFDQAQLDESKRQFAQQQANADREFAFAQEQSRFQQDLALNGISLRMADAERAGLHPTVALGVPSSGGQAVSVGSSVGTGMPGRSAGGYDPDYTSTYRAIGQAVDEALSRNLSPEQKELNVLTLSNARLDNEERQVRLEALKKELAVSKGIPHPSVSSSKSLPGQITKSPDAPLRGYDPSSESFAISSIGWARTPGGGYMPVPSKDVKERLEDNELLEKAWFAWAVKARPPDNLMRPGSHVWEFSPTDGWVDRPIRNSDAEKVKRFLPRGAPTSFDMFGPRYKGER